MPDREESSLDRLVRTRAPMLLGVPEGLIGSRAWSIAGGLQVLGGGAALAVALLSGAGAEMQAFGFIGVWLSLQGLYYLGAGRVKDRASTAGVPQVRLTDEAAGLMRRLAEGLDTSMAVPWRRGPGRAANLLAPEAFQLLDDAARHYNRVQGVLAIEGSRANRTLERMAPNIRAAADEALAELLHAAALIQRFPESAEVHLAGAQGRLTALRELASEVERTQTAGNMEVGSFPPRSRLDGVLDELRSDHLARQEIEAAPAVQELRRRG